MKALLTIPILISAAITGLASLRLFQQAHYNMSQLLTVTTFLSLVLFVALLSNAGNKKALTV